MQIRILVIMQTHADPDALNNTDPCRSECVKLMQTHADPDVQHWRKLRLNSTSYFGKLARCYKYRTFYAIFVSSIPLFNRKTRVAICIYRKGCNRIHQTSAMELQTRCKRLKYLLGLIKNR